MAKMVWKPGNMLYPVPVVMVSCGDMETNTDLNIITIAWTGTINTNPPMTYISIRPERHSYDIIKKYGSFVINIATEQTTKATDFCGVKSGRDIDKFTAAQLTAEKSQMVCAPSIKESPINIECRLKEIKELGSHHMFLADVVSVSADDVYMDETGKFHLDQAKPISYVHGRYYGLGKNTGKFGYSIKKPKKRTK